MKSEKKTSSNEFFFCYGKKKKPLQDREGQGKNVEINYNKYDLI